MSSEVWSFMEFQSSSGRLVITQWRDDLSPARRALFDMYMDRYSKLSEWDTGWHKPLTNHKGCSELRFKAEKVQHRILGYIASPKCFAMLVGCTHKQKVYDPPSAFDTLDDRKSKIARGEGALVAYKLEPIA